jgi:thiol-disulfide isomerase/thioredoxin
MLSSLLVRSRPSYLAALTIAFLVACQREPPSAPLPVVERPLELLALPTLAGTSLDVESLRGKVVVVNFWSPSCGACLKETPGLQAVADELRGRGLELVTVMMEGSRPAAERFVSQTGLTAPTLIGTPQVAGAYRMLVYPWTVILDRSGKAVFAIRGARDEATFRKAFARYL